MNISRHDDRFRIEYRLAALFAGTALLASSALAGKPAAQAATQFSPSRIEVAIANEEPTPDLGSPAGATARDAQLGVYFQIALGRKASLDETVKVYLDGELVGQKFLALQGPIAAHEELILVADAQIPPTVGLHVVRVVTTGTLASDRSWALAF